MLRLLTIILLSVASANAAIPIIFLRAGTNAVVIPPDPTNEVGGFYTNMFIDAEDFNYRGLDDDPLAGGYFPSKPGTNFNATSTYLGFRGSEPRDYRASQFGTTQYRDNTLDVQIVEHDDNHEPNGVPYTDYKIWKFGSSDFLTYARQFSNSTYRIYARVAATAHAIGSELYVIRDESYTNATGSQNVELLAGFGVTGAGTNAFFYTPFVTNGVAFEIALSGTNALQVLSTNGLHDFHRLMLVRWTGTPMGFANPETDPDVIFVDENGDPFYDPEIL